MNLFSKQNLMWNPKMWQIKVEQLWLQVLCMLPRQPLGWVQKPYDSGEDSLTAITLGPCWKHSYRLHFCRGLGLVLRPKKLVKIQPWMQLLRHILSACDSVFFCRFQVSQDRRYKLSSSVRAVYCPPDLEQKDNENRLEFQASCVGWLRVSGVNVSLSYCGIWISPPMKLGALNFVF